MTTPTRCKHEVWLGDHCYQCEAERGDWSRSLPVVQTLEPIEVDPNTAYLDKGGNLRFLPAPPIYMTIEEFKEKYMVDIEIVIKPKVLSVIPAEGAEG